MRGNTHKLSAENRRVHITISLSPVALAALDALCERGGTLVARSRIIEELVKAEVEKE